jgi:hypothetical protein
MPLSGWHPGRCEQPCRLVSKHCKRQHLSWHMLLSPACRNARHWSQCMHMMHEPLLSSTGTVGALVCEMRQWTREPLLRRVCGLGSHACAGRRQHAMSITGENKIERTPLSLTATCHPHSPSVICCPLCHIHCSTSSAMQDVAWDRVLDGRMGCSCHIHLKVLQGAHSNMAALFRVLADSDDAHLGHSVAPCMLLRSRSFESGTISNMIHRLAG